MGWGMAAAIGGSLLGNVLTNDAARSRAHEAQDFSAEQYATRWQTTTKDMQAAGLNPMLAYTQGVGQSPQGVNAPVQDYGEALERGIRASTSAQQSRVNSAQVANIEADTRNKDATSALIDSQTHLNMASAGQAFTQSAVNQELVSKISQEAMNARTEGDRLRSVIENIAAETGLLRNKQETEVYTWDQIKAITAKVLTETGLNNLDLEAAKNLDNFGRYSKELKPVIDLVFMLLKHDLRK